MWSHILLGQRPVFLKTFEKLVKMGGDYSSESSDLGRVGSVGERTGGKPSLRAVERGMPGFGM